MLEAIISGVVSNSVFEGLKYGTAEAQDLLAREKYEQEVDAITAAVTTALKESVVPTLVSDTGMTETQLGDEWDWAAIAAELDVHEVWDQDRQTAIVHLTDAIEAGLDFEFKVDSTRRTTLEAAVAAGYKHAVRQFIEEIAGTPLADKLELLTDRELLTIADTIEERLTALEQELRGTRAQLRDVGIERLDPLYFERHEPGNPETAWRRGFTLAEIAAGYPLSRERPATSNSERVALTEEIYDQLTAGEHVVVVGEVGSGKSTVCKQVARQWHSATDQGVVLYRPSATTTTFDQPGTLIETIRTTEETLLVVVEDAPRKDASGIFEVLAEFGPSEEVAVLLDTRKGNWDDGMPLGGHTRLDHQRQHLTRVDMPVFDERECQRAIDHYQEVIGETPGRSSEQVFEEVRGAELGGPLVVAYQLTGPAIEAEQPTSALHKHVYQAYTDVKKWADGDDLSETVAVMVNVLNAADLPVEAAFIHALVGDRDDHQRIEHTLDFLEGTIFEQSGSDFRMPHPLWSALYLEQMLDTEGKRLARDRFERCVEALFRLIDDQSRRERVVRWVRTPPEPFTAITETPEETAGHFVWQVTEIGRNRPTLGVLYGPFETWGVPLPDPCPISVPLQWVATCGQIHHHRGAFDAAQAALERADRLIDTAQNELAASGNYRAKIRHNLGNVALKRGEFETAEAYFEESLALKREIGDRRGEASSLHNLGNVASARGEFETAEAYYEESLALKRKIGDRPGEATSLGNLGNVALKREEVGTAEAYYEESLALKREIGDRLGEATNLNNLGEVAFKRGEFETAEAYYEESLALCREVGDFPGEAKSLANLVRLAKTRDDLAVAEEYLEASLALFQEKGIIGEALDCFTELIDVCADRGAEERAIEWCEEAIHFAEQIAHETERAAFQEYRSTLLDTEEK